MYYFLLKSKQKTTGGMGNLVYLYRENKQIEMEKRNQSKSLNWFGNLCSSLNFFFQVNLYNTVEMKFENLIEEVR